MVPHYVIHHNEASYEESVALAHSAFCPLSIDPRGCVGRGLAMKEMIVVVARLSYLWENKDQRRL